MKTNRSNKIAWLILVMVAIGCVFLLSPSPSTKGTYPHLKAATEVNWDALGIPIIQAKGQEDAYFVQGYITAQDRFFQMELVRRKMAGRLAELFGSQALSADTSARKWNYSRVSKEAIEHMIPERRKLLSAYAAGVNALLNEKNPSWEMKVLGIKPELWRPEDSILVVLSMYESLNRFDSPHERAMEILRNKFKPQTVSFLTPDWGFLDAPIIEDSIVLPSFSVPLPSEIKVNDKSARVEPHSQGEVVPGSNAWAISGKYTHSGLPLLSSDPHLDLRVPNIWFRLGIHTPQTAVYGVTIPGIPGIVIGHNEKVAWAFTNSAIDNVDEVKVPKQSTLLAKRHEQIQIKNESPQEVSFIDSPWGPVIEEGLDSDIALQWTALDPDNLANLSLVELNEAQNTQDLLIAFGLWAGPPQNAIFATGTGDIGWTIAGQLPNRVGFDGQSRAERSQTMKWNGYVSRKNFPVVINPSSGFIVSANQRTVPITGPYNRFGHFWPNSARAKRIQDLLTSHSKPFTAESCLEVQTDVLSLTHLWYRDQLMSCSLRAEDPKEERWLVPALEIISQWKGKAEVQSSAYPIIKYFREELFNELIGPIAQAISPLEKETIFSHLRSDGLIQNLLEHRPKHLLPPPYSSFCEVMKQTLLNTVRGLVASPEQLKNLKWGDFNQSKIKHPFSRKLPSFLGQFLNFPIKPMPGDSLVPNVMTPTNGVSMRMIIDFSDKTRSLFSQPGGQSSNPLSNHYSDSFRSWLEGTAAPFEPGATVRNQLFLPTQ